MKEAAWKLLSDPTFGFALVLGVVGIAIVGSFVFDIVEARRETRETKRLTDQLARDMLDREWMRLERERRRSATPAVERKEP